MKKIKSVLVLLSVTASVSVQASSFVEYRPKDYMLLESVATTCPAELVKAMQGADAIVSVTAYGSMGPDALYNSLVVVTGKNDAKIGTVDPVNTLHIKKVTPVQWIDGKMSNGKVELTCEVKKAE